MRASAVSDRRRQPYSSVAAGGLRFSSAAGLQHPLVVLLVLGDYLACAEPCDGGVARSSSHLAPFLVVREERALRISFLNIIFVLFSYRRNLFAR